MSKKTQSYTCPKCGGRLLRVVRRGRIKENYQHFQCEQCRYALLAEYDPKELRKVAL